jgi:thiaminase
MLAKAPERARRPLHAGLTALEAELDWFAALANERDLPHEEPHPACSRYTDFLTASAYTEPFSRLVQILFGVECCYLHAWSALAGDDLPEGIHGEIVTRWSSAGFAAYVEELDALTLDWPHPDDEGFRRVLALERDFWRMTWEDFG